MRLAFLQCLSLLKRMSPSRLLESTLRQVSAYPKALCHQILHPSSLYSYCLFHPFRRKCHLDLSRSIPHQRDQGSLDPFQRCHLRFIHQAPSISPQSHQIHPCMAFQRTRPKRDFHTHLLSFLSFRLQVAASYLPFLYVSLTSLVVDERVKILRRLDPTANQQCHRFPCHEETFD